MTRKLFPSVALCRSAKCPDLVEVENLTGQPHQACGPAGLRIPGNLKECPTGYLDEAARKVREMV